MEQETNSPDGHPPPQASAEEKEEGPSGSGHQSAVIIDKDPDDNNEDVDVEEDGHDVSGASLSGTGLESWQC